MAESVWRLLRDGSREGSWNMAVDESVAHAVGQARVPPTLRLYGWSQPTVSLGYFQRSKEGVDWAACGRLGISIVRRPTGGRAVLHAQELTYSAAFPTNGFWGNLSVADSFSLIGHALVAGLRRMGISAAIGPGTAEHPDPSCSGRHACFQLHRMPAILVAGKKLIGSAQRRWGRSVLQHGSLLLGFDIATQQAVFPTWNRPAEDVTWLGALVGTLPAQEVVEAALASGWGESTGARVTPGALLAEEVQAAEGLVRSRYGNPAWTLRGCSGADSEQAKRLTH